MTCKEFVDFLGDYLDGELAPDVRHEFRKHIDDCPECVAYMQTYECTVRLGQGAFCHADDPVPEEIPEGLVQAILQAAKKRD